MGGMIKYILDNKLYFEEYMLDYTNASFIVNDAFGFSDGLFAGYDDKKRSYDKSKWAFAMDEKGVPKRDPSLKNPLCVINLLKKHYDRYTLKKVSEVTGTPEADLLKVYKAYSATGKT